MLKRHYLHENIILRETKRFLLCSYLALPQYVVSVAALALDARLDAGRLLLDRLDLLLDARQVFASLSKRESVLNRSLLEV